MCGLGHPSTGRRQTQLEEEYTEAFAEWDGSGDAALWDRTSGDVPRQRITEIDVALRRHPAP
ncbi:hypothetical protein CTU88_06925 [Streptomyces sp. JV178]|nr:hypothetical protein CTU88_06925 [Streptomyces sp. JV178]